MASITVFRAGDLAKPDSYGPSQAEYEAIDALAPAGRATRLTGIFASPDLRGLGRWVSANSTFGLPFTPRALSIDPADVWVYSIKAWDVARCPGVGQDRQRAYWESGIALADFARVAAERDLSGFDWEVLVPPSAILGSKAVSLDRLLTHARPADRCQIAGALAPERSARWRAGVRERYARKDALAAAT